MEGQDSICFLSTGTHNAFARSRRNSSIRHQTHRNFFLGVRSEDLYLREFSKEGTSYFGPYRIPPNHVESQNLGVHYFLLGCVSIKEQMFFSRSKETLRELSYHIPTPEKNEVPWSRF